MDDKQLLVLSFVLNALSGILIVISVLKRKKRIETAGFRRLLGMAALH